MEKFVGTRTATQARSHAQKYYAKLEKMKSPKTLLATCASCDPSEVRTQSSTPISSPVCKPSLTDNSENCPKSHKKSCRNSKRVLSFVDGVHPPQKVKRVTTSADKKLQRADHEDAKAVSIPKDAFEMDGQSKPLLDDLSSSENESCSVVDAPVLMCLRNDETYKEPLLDFGDFHMRLPEPQNFLPLPSEQQGMYQINESSFFAEIPAAMHLFPSV